MRLGRGDFRLGRGDFRLGRRLHFGLRRRIGWAGPDRRAWSDDLLLAGRSLGLGDKVRCRRFRLDGFAGLRRHRRAERDLAGEIWGDPRPLQPPAAVGHPLGQASQGRGQLDSRGGEPGGQLLGEQAAARSGRGNLLSGLGGKRDQAHGAVGLDRGQAGSTPALRGGGAVRISRVQQQHARVGAGSLHAAQHRGQGDCPGDPLSRMAKVAADRQQEIAAFDLDRIAHVEEEGGRAGLEPCGKVDEGGAKAAVGQVRLLDDLDAERAQCLGNRRNVAAGRIQRVVMAIGAVAHDESDRRPVFRLGAEAQQADQDEGQGPNAVRVSRHGCPETRGPSPPFLQ